MTSITLQYRGIRWSQPKTGWRSPTLLLGIVAGLAAFGAVAADIVHRSNVSRVTHYQDDALCWAPISEPITVKGSACRVDSAQVVERWITTSQRGTRSFHFALRTTDGLVDSVELKGTDRRDLWDATPLASSLLVQRFRESRRPHVTVVQNVGFVSRTEWNPVWRADDAMVGTVFLTAVAAGACIALFIARAKERRDAALRRLSLEAVGEF